MTKPKADKGKKQDKASEETTGQHVLELATQATTATEAELACEHDTGSSTILAAINNMSKTMNVRFNDLEATLASTQASLLNLVDRIKEVEEATSNHEGRLSKLEETCARTQAENEALRVKMIDLEARSRRQNIKIIGLPEKIEGGSPREFLMKFIPELLGADHFHTQLEVDRAHRLGTRLPGDNARPRAMIARIHYFHVKEMILRLARQQFPLRHKDKSIYIFPDYPAEVIRQRQAFDSVKKRLQDAGARCGVLYPARLRVTIGSTDKTFSSPRDAEVFAETLQSH
ncbi:uncharacterized protein LOC106515067 [Austrofundulus limnaeus]|uniref:Uncharacterized protein LOC106515067 n=1 Tax=Austrofundulus limnaeus TaxID=52670 RepID=A0A2I4AXD6_AUSLI|nr:PREDICTED: uncharacterized protein LOC106515067 [Austrofundulus limnaeus]